jgi:2-polyprenyl-3-methyl-5-hydroxy-6-metoxy-1,4-benzoquinol methylase
VTDDAGGRERDFWDHHVPSLEESLDEYRRGPDAFCAEMLEAVEPTGKRVLDFACGAGVTTAWLAARGADVVGVDLSPTSIRRAEELRTELNLSYQVRVVSADPGDLDLGSFDALTGRCALHHLDLSAYAPALARLVRDGGSAAFLETIANPLLSFARDNLAGRPGISRFGTTDEHPLTRRDLEILRTHFGELEIRVPSMTFFRLVDRHILHGKRPTLKRWFDSLDEFLWRRPRLRSLSYWQVLVLRRSGSASSSATGR